MSNEAAPPALYHAGLRFGGCALLLALFMTAPDVRAQSCMVQTCTGSVSCTLANVLPPEICSGGVVNAASYARPSVLTPGAIFSLFGSLLGNTTASPVGFYAPTDGHPVICVTDLETCLKFSGLTALPSNWFLPSGTDLIYSVWVNGVPAPLFFISPRQFNFQVPFELAGTGSASVEVRLNCPQGQFPGNCITSTSLTFAAATASPGIFTVNMSGSGQGAVLVASTGQVVAPAGKFSGSRPASRGEYISVYATGLGLVTNPPRSGRPALQSPLSFTTANPVVTIGNIQASVSFSGLAPGFVGLYQINAQIPATAPTGDAVPLALTAGGYGSNTVTIAIAP